MPMTDTQPPTPVRRSRPRRLRILSFAGLAALTTLLLTSSGVGGPIPASAADRLLEKEAPRVAAAQSASEIADLRSRYQRELASSETPQGYLALLAMLEPINNPNAVELLEQACQGDPTFALGRVDLARAMAFRNPNKQGALLREAWALRPDDLAVARAEGEWLLAAGDHDALAEVCEALLQENAPVKSLALGHYFAGRRSWIAKDWKNALRHLSEAAQLDAQDADFMIWWILLAVSRGEIEQAGKLVESRSENSLSQAKMSAGLANALNVMARRELAPAGDPVSPAFMVWRRQLVRGLDKVRPQLPYGSAWEADRLGIWLDFAEGRYSGAWKRFQNRIPPDLIRGNADALRSRWDALREAIETPAGEAEATHKRMVCDAAINVGWTAEALELARQLAQGETARPEDLALARRLEAHQAYVARLSQLFQTADQKTLTVPPDPPEALGFLPRPGERHPESGSNSFDPTVRYFRNCNQYFAWMSAAWEDKAYRLMAIYSENPAYPVQKGGKTLSADVIVGEDLIPPAGVAAGSAGLTDNKRRDHSHIGLIFDDTIEDVFVQQADKKARLRIDAYTQQEPDSSRVASQDEEGFSPDELAVMAQALFEEKGIGSCAFDRKALPKPDECRKFREEALLGLIDHVGKHEACHLALQSKGDIRSGRKELHANLYALAQGRWPKLGLYYAYRAALMGSASHRDIVNAIAQGAAERGYVRKDLQPLIQLHSLSDLQIKSLGEDGFKRVD